MIVLGLLLVAAAAAFGIELFVSNNSSEVLGEVFGQDITRLSAGGYFLLGSATTVALFFGVLLMDAGLRSSRRRRHELKEQEARQVEAARQAQWEKAAAVSEAERLRDELVEERMNQATLGGVVMPPDVESPGEVPTETAAPVDDPEHARSDRRGILGRLRGDRGAAGDRSADRFDGDRAQGADAGASSDPPPPAYPPPAGPRPESATEAFNAAVAPSTERDQPPQR